MDTEALKGFEESPSGPKIVITQAGQINTGAFDPFSGIALLEEHDFWWHVDGAFGLWARANPDGKFLAEGAELIDSWATDGHKWLQTPYDCGYAIVRHEGPIGILWPRLATFPKLKRVSVIQPNTY